MSRRKNEVKLSTELTPKQIVAELDRYIVGQNHAKKAVLTGMDMQKKLDPLNQLFQEKGLPCIKVGIGINTAICNIGDMGSKFRRNYTVIGDGVNLASRLEFLCRRYNVGVIVGENTFQATKKDFLYLQLDRVNVKGKLLAENIYLPIVVIEESNADLEGLVAAHHAALQSYFNQEWKKAIKQFKALAKTSLYVDLCQVFLERIDFFQQQPLSPNWSGAYEMNEK
jgi:adenylate cyclase